MAAISTWSTTAGSNNAAVPDGAPENWRPSEVNNWGRETMAAVRTWYEDAEWIDWGHTLAFVSTTQFTTAAGDGDTTAIYHVGRRIRATVTAGTVYGVITASSHAAQTTVTVSLDSGNLDSGLSAAAVGANSADNPSIGSSAISDPNGLITFPAGTRMLFQQTAAPTGWTKDTTAAINDIALRLTTGTVTNSTGNDKFSTVFGSSITTATYALVEGDIPQITHWNTASTKLAISADSVTSTFPNNVTTTFGNSPADGHSHSMTMDLDYYEAILASKD